MKEILIVGAGSGLGRSVYEKFGTFRWDRDISLKERQKLKDNGVDIIIHTAFNPIQKVDSTNLTEYVSDNILLTSELVSIPHQKFIFVSSVDVYPKDSLKHKEEETISLNEVGGIYGISKLMSESLVKKNCLDYLILRCSGLLGRYSRKNSLIKIMDDENCTLTLRSDSNFNYILHSDVANFIQQAIENDIQGIFNIASSKNMTLEQIANSLGRKVTFGDYFYNVGNIDSSKIMSLHSAFAKSTAQVIFEFAQARVDWQ